MTTTPPLSWLRTITDKQRALQQIPLWGHLPTFPVEELSHYLQELLHSDTVHIEFGNTHILTSAELEKQLGPNAKTLSFQLSPLSGELFFSVPSTPFSALISLLLYGCSQSHEHDTLSNAFQEGFYQFLLLELCAKIESLHVYRDLHIQWNTFGSLPPLTETYTCVDVRILFQETTFTGMLCMSDDVKQALCAHESNTPKSLQEFPLTSSLDVFMRLCLGHTQIDFATWQTIRVGDFLLFDCCTYDPSTCQGSIDLFWDELALFTGEISPHGLTLTDYTVYHGELVNMDTQPPSSFEGDEENSFTPMEEEMLSEEELDQAKPLPPKKETPKQAAPQPEAPKPETSPVTHIKEVPFPIVIELDRIKMPLEKLLQLTPGNVLELSVRPEQGVFLTVHGKRVARGELLKLGDMLGVKITELGS